MRGRGRVGCTAVVVWLRDREENVVVGESSFGGAWMGMKAVISRGLVDRDSRKLVRAPSVQLESGGRRNVQWSYGRILRCFALSKRGHSSWWHGGVRRFKVVPARHRHFGFQPQCA